MSSYLLYSCSVLAASRQDDLAAVTGHMVLKCTSSGNEKIPIFLLKILFSAFIRYFTVSVVIILEDRSNNFVLDVSNHSLPRGETLGFSD